ncbi:MAG: response regulator [Planctomycetota bacterium]|jgi:CheY-like chemotaxis protein
MSDASKTILVVEDVPDERSFLTTMLEDAGFRVVEAADGTEALARIAEDRPDLVTLDITMPEKSGVAVYRKLKEDESLRDIPVIIVTGISSDFKKFISSRRQVPPPEGYVSKPVDHEEFLKTVGELLG